MKALQRLCAGGVLVLALALPALAGHIPCPGVTDPPPTEETAAPATDDAGAMGFALTLLQDVLSVL